MVNLDPEFRNQTDLLFFTNRLDIDLSSYKDKFEQSSEHVDYLLDRFFKGSQIFWANSAEVWQHRFSVLLSLEHSGITRAIEKHISKKAYELFRKVQKEYNDNLEYIQYLELCKVKWFRKESLSYVRNYLLDLPDSIKPWRVIPIIESFIPYVFKDLNEYISYLCKRIIYSVRNLIILRELKKQGFDYDVSMLRERIDIILKSNVNIKHAKAFAALLYEESILDHLKNNLSLENNKKILLLIKELSFKELEENNYFIFKALTDINSEFTNSLLAIYIIKLMSRGSKHIKSNCNKIAKLNQAVSIFSSKEIFRYLLSIDRANYIKILCSSFPEFKELIAFI